MDNADQVTILVCDDEPQMRALIRATLERSGHDLVEATNGDEAIAMAREARPALILLDMMMPGRTGLQVIEELRRDGQFADTRIVMLTARTQASDRSAAASVGADRFLAKPFSPLELLALVDELLAAR